MRALVVVVLVVEATLSAAFRAPSPGLRPPHHRSLGCARAHRSALTRRRRRGGACVRAAGDDDSGPSAAERPDVSGRVIEVDVAPEAVADVAGAGDAGAPVAGAAPADTSPPTLRRPAAADDESRESVAALLANAKYEAVLSPGVTLLSCFAYAVATVPSLPLELTSSLQTLETYTSVFFLAEYFSRWFSRKFEPSFVLEPLNVVDLVSFLPLIAEELLGYSYNFSFLRLLRILRLQRLLTDVETFSLFGQALGFSSVSSGDRARDETYLQLARVISTLFTLLFVASGAIYAAESEANSSINDFFDALYFGLTTLTTVGFGDIVPVTPAGRLVVSASTVFGIGLVPLQLTGLAETILKESRGKTSRPRGMRVDRLARRCGSCGEKAHRRDASFCFRCGNELPD